ncbi:MAG: hypothetical protein HYV07_14250 [Deltaproteobacteria bacterium]|nr:hypothetical protein [Deltaproteobacteria bacterium]
MRSTAVLLLLVASRAFAGEIESRARLIQPEALRSSLARGDLALIESDGDALKQVLLLSPVDAPPDKVFDLLMDVEAYPKFVATIASTLVLKRGGSMLEYRWKLDVPLISLQGTRLQRGRRPTLVEVRFTSGNFEGSRERWELYPLDGGKRTLVACYRKLETSTAGMVMQAVASLEPSFPAALSVASSFVHVRSIQRHVAKLPPLALVEQTGPVPPFARIPLGDNGLSLSTIEPFLDLGILAMIESNADGTLRQVALLTKVASDKAKVQAIVADPGKFPEFIQNFARQDVTPIDARRTKLDWELEIPFKNLEGEAEMTVDPDGTVEVVNTKGDITRGRFRWEVLEAGPGKSIPIHYAYTDVREASFFTRALVERQPLVEHGIVIASGTVALAAVKARAEGRR